MDPKANHPWKRFSIPLSRTKEDALAVARAKDRRKRTAIKVAKSNSDAVHIQSPTNKE